MTLLNYWQVECDRCAGSGCRECSWTGRIAIRVVNERRGARAAAFVSGLAFAVLFALLMRIIARWVH